MTPDILNTLLSLKEGQSVISVEEWHKVYFVRFNCGSPKFVSKKKVKQAYVILLLIQESDFSTSVPEQHFLILNKCYNALAKSNREDVRIIGESLKRYLEDKKSVLAVGRAARQLHEIYKAA